PHRPGLACIFLVQEDHGLAVRHIVLREVAPGPQRDAHGVEIAGARHVDERRGPIPPVISSPSEIPLSIPSSGSMSVIPTASMPAMAVTRRSASPPPINLAS